MGRGESCTDHLARLVRQLRTPGSRPDQVRETLRLLAAAARERGVRWQCDGARLLVDDVPVASAAAEALVERFAAHGVHRLSVRQHATAVELLQCARLLSEPAAPDTFDARVASARLWQVAIARADDEDAADSALGPAIPEHAAIAPHLFRLRGARTPDAMQGAVESAAALEGLGRQHEAARHARAYAAVLVGLVRAEREAEGDAVRAACGRAIDAIATPTALRLVAGLLPSVAEHPTAHAAHLEALGRCGQPAGAALIAFLMAADAMQERRIYYDAIVQLRLGISILIGALAHPQWYIVRNAAGLLGDMGAAPADKALARLLDHPDERAREAAIAALAKLDTRTARLALQQLLQDRSPSVRLYAVKAFASNREARIAAPLAVALDTEEDGDVQLGLLAGLGQLGTPDAVEKLMRAALPSDMRPRPAVFRIAALEALVVARGAAAQSTVQALLGDAEPAVREAAERLARTVVASVAA
ncbi:MAG: HEAT repeat domain-containing protein [Gemmatirosa sp.]